MVFVSSFYSYISCLILVKWCVCSCLCVCVCLPASMGVNVRLNKSCRGGGLLTPPQWVGFGTSQQPIVSHNWVM